MCPDSAKRSRAFQLYQSNRRNQNNICEQPCVFTNMYFGPPVKVPRTKDPLPTTHYLCYLIVKTPFLSSKGTSDPGEDTGQMVLYFRRNVKVISFENVKVIHHPRSTMWKQAYLKLEIM